MNSTRDKLSCSKVLRWWVNIFHFFWRLVKIFEMVGGIFQFHPPRLNFFGPLTLFSIFTHSVFWVITFHPPNHHLNRSQNWNTRDRKGNTHYKKSHWSVSIWNWFQDHDAYLNCSPNSWRPSTHYSLCHTLQLFPWLFIDNLESVNHRKLSNLNLEKRQTKNGGKCYLSRDQTDNCCNMIKVDRSTWSTGVDSYWGAPLVGPRWRCICPSCRSPHALPMDRFNNSKGEQGATAFAAPFTGIHNEFQTTVHYLARPRLPPCTSLWWLYVSLIFMFDHREVSDAHRGNRRRSCKCVTSIHQLSSRGNVAFFFLVLCRHTACAPITSGTVTGGVQ